MLYFVQILKLTVLTFFMKKCYNIIGQSKESK